jgi:type IV secretory pathway VirB4 component
MNLAEYRRSNTRLSDFLPWAALVDEGIVLNKDGSFQRRAKFRGPDLDSAVPAELVAVAGRLNNALRRLESGWAIFVEAQRHSAGAYPPDTFPDAASSLVDAERRAQFEEAGAHFESSYFLTFLYLPPAEGTAKAERLLYEGSNRSVGGDAREILRGFTDRTAVCCSSSKASCRSAPGSATRRRSPICTRRSRPSGIASGCPKSLCISTRCSPISH